MANNNISENLFQAIDILTAKKLQGLKFDKTLLCEIIDDRNAEKGEYKVSDNSSNFTAYTDVTTYRNGMHVYVTIPEGDFSQRKLITGKYVEDGGEHYTYLAPFDSYLDITNNFIDKTIDTVMVSSNFKIEGVEDTSTSEAKEVSTKSLLANGAISEHVLFQWQRSDESIIPKQYTRMGVKADFRTWLNHLQPVIGSYGLRVDVVSRETTAVLSDEITHKNYSFYLDSSDFYGDIYNFETYYTQEGVFDISEITEIYSFRVVFYQSNNFYDISKNKIPTIENGEVLDDNIFIDNLYLSFGFDASQFIDDEVFLYTLDGETYDVAGQNVERYVYTQVDSSTVTSTNITEYYILVNNKYRKAVVGEVGPYYQRSTETYNRNIKNLQVRWVHFAAKDHAIMIDDVKDFSTEEATLHWYEYVQDKSVCDPIASYHWKEREDLKNCFEYELTPDITKQEEKYMVIIEYPNATWIENKIAAEIANLGPEEEYAQYVYKDYSDSEDEEVQKQSGWYWVPRATTVDKDGNTVELPYAAGSLHKRRYELNNADTGLIPALTAKIESGKAEVGDKALLNEYELELKSIETSLQSFADGVKKITEEYSEQLKYYKSDVLVLTNETEVPHNTNLELVDGLNIIVDEHGLQGNYCIYSMTNEIMKSTDAMRKRTLEAIYQSLITHDDKLDKASSICWKIPATNTMIAEPVLGEEYVTKTYVDNLTEDEKKAKDYKEIDYILEEATIDGKNVRLVDANTGELIPYNGFYYLFRKGTEVYHSDDEDNETVNSQQISVKQYYKIKKYFQQGSKNNTVYCDVIKNGFTYSANATMTFGLHGTNGTDNTLILQMRKYKFEGETVVPLDLVSVVHPNDSDVFIEARLFDYNNEELQIEKVEWSMYSEGSKKAVYVDTAKRLPIEYTRTQKTSMVDQFGEIVEQEQEITVHAIPIVCAEITKPEEFDLEDIKSFMHNIVQADVVYGECTVGEGYSEATAGVDFENVDEAGEAPKLNYTPKTRTVHLTTYLPIPFTNSNLEWAEIPTQIIYDASGANPSYYKNEIKICDDSGNYVTLNACKVYHGDVDKDGNMVNNAYYPTIKSTELGYSLKPLNMFFNSGLTTQISILCTIGTNKYWVQPILMIQNRWPSSVLNEWDGSLTIDEKNGTILSSMVGAGKKEDDNTYTGVLMGQVSALFKNDDDQPENMSLTGLFGYHHGVQSFGFMENGKAFIGKAGKGRIEFDGNNGRIKSMSYDVDRGTGMLIDLDDGIIDMHGSTSEGITEDNNNTYKKVYTASGSRILLDVAPKEGKPYFLIQATDKDYQDVTTTGNDNITTRNLGENKDLIYVGAAKYYLKTIDYRPKRTDSPGQGMKIDLAKGSIEGYNFSLQGYCANGTRYDGSYFELNSSGNPFFKIHYKDSQGSTKQQQGLDIINIARDNFELRSQNYDTDLRRGLEFDLTDGKLKGYDFTLISQGGSDEGEEVGTDKSYVRLSNTSPYFIINDNNGNRLVNISNAGYYLQSSTGTAKLDLKNASLVFNNANGGYVKMDGDGTPFFQINNGSTNLFYCTNGDYYLQSANEKAKFDLDNNTFKIESSSGGYVKMEGDGNPFFQIYDGSTSIFYAGIGNYYMESSGGWNSSSSGGLKIDFKNGKMEGGAGAKNWSIEKDGTATFNKLITNGEATIGGDITIEGDCEVKGTLRSGESGAYYKFENATATIGGWKITKTTIESTTGAIKLKSDGNVVFESGEGSFEMGVDTIHPSASGLNIITNKGISFRTDGSNQDASLDIQSYSNLLWGNSAKYLTVTGNFAVTQGAYFGSTVSFMEDMCITTGKGFKVADGKVVGNSVLSWAWDGYSNGYTETVYCDDSRDLTSYWTITITNGIITNVSNSSEGRAQVELRDPTGLV